MEIGRSNLASVTSIVGRLPVFDFYNHNGLCYLRFDSNVEFAMSKDSKVYVVPTDDLRLKFLVIPVSD